MPDEHFNSTVDPSDINVVKHMVITAVIVTNVILNSLVIAVIARYPQLREDRTTLFVFSLTLSDLALGCSVMPISIALCSNAAPPNTAHYLPAIQRCLFAWFSFSSAHSLCWLTVTKMIALIYPFRYEQHFTPRLCYSIIGCIWLTGALVAIAGTQTVVQWSPVSCTFSADVPSQEPLVKKIGFVLSTVPLIGIVYATVRILYVIVHAQRQITAQVNSIGGQPRVVETNASLTLQSIRSGRNVLLVCLGVLVLSMPVIIMVLASFVGINLYALSQIFTFLAVWLGMCNSFVNSLLYVILFRSVRAKTTALLKEIYNRFHNC